MKCFQQRNAGKQIRSYTSGAPADSGLEQQGEQEAAPEAQGEGAGLGGGGWEDAEQKLSAGWEERDEPVHGNSLSWHSYTAGVKGKQQKLRGPHC